MYRRRAKQSLLPDEFFLPFTGKLNEENRWVKLTQLIRSMGNLSGRLKKWMERTQDPLLTGKAPRPEGAKICKRSSLTAALNELD